MEENQRSFRLYWIPISFGLFALPFQDRISYLIAILSTLAFALCALSVGRRLLRKRIDTKSLYFPFGLGVILLVAYPIFSISTFLPLIYVLWAVVAVLGVSESRVLMRRVPLRWIWLTPLIVFGFWICLTPSLFFDALVYHLGLPHQAIAAGRMIQTPDHLYSTFPPFEQTLNIFFVAIEADSGIKIFSFLIFIAILWNALDFVKETVGKEFNALPRILAVLLIPSFWILVHLITADLLASLFFSSGVLLLLHKKDFTISAILIAFSVWTKWNVLLYIPFLIFLMDWRPFRDQLQRNLVFFVFLFLLVSPLLLRNSIHFGDPLYPVLSQSLSNPLWAEQQQTALSNDSFPSRVRSVSDLLSVPLRLIRIPGSFGSGSEIGMVPILSLVFYFLARQKLQNRILVYVLLCSVAWIFVFPNFRQFFSVFVLLVPLVFTGWAAVFEKRMPLYIAAIFICAVHSYFTMRPLFHNYFPLIPVTMSQNEYLRNRLDYFPVAEFASERGKPGISMGETRFAHFDVPVIGGTAYNYSLFLTLMKQSRNAEMLNDKLKQKGIGFVLIHRSEFNRIAKKYGLWKVSDEESELLQEFFGKFTVVSKRHGPVFYAELK